MSVVEERVKGKEKGERGGRRVGVYRVNRQERRGEEKRRSKKEYNEDEAALAARLRPITLLLPLSSISPLLSFPLCPLTFLFSPSLSLSLSLL